MSSLYLPFLKKLLLILFIYLLLNLLASKTNKNKNNDEDVIENGDVRCSNNRSNIFIIYLFIYSANNIITLKEKKN